MGRFMKRLVSAVVTGISAFSMGTGAFAAARDTGFADVTADVWYADAVAYVQDNGLMSGTGDALFSPDAGMTRAMLATVLYRAAGSPTVSGADSFTDTAADTWYSDAVVWVSAQGLVNGYGDGTFGTNNPVSREQIAAILCAMRAVRTHSPVPRLRMKIKSPVMRCRRWTGRRARALSTAGRTTSLCPMEAQRAPRSRRS